jgi:hypothetical protein
MSKCPPHDIIHMDRKHGLKSITLCVRCRRLLSPDDGEFDKEEIEALVEFSLALREHHGSTVDKRKRRTKV